MAKAKGSASQADGKGNGKVGRRRGYHRIDSDLNPPGWRLSVQKQMFVAYYMGDAKFNACEAARMAGFGKVVQAARDLMKDPGVVAAIRAKMDAAGLSAVELLAREAEIIRFNIDDIMSYVAGQWRFDYQKARRNGKLHLIKGVKVTKYGLDVEVEDKSQARERMMRVHGMFRDRVDVKVTHELDFTRVPMTQEGLAFLQAASSGQLDEPTLLHRYQAIVSPQASSQPASAPLVIEGNGLVREEAPDPPEEAE